MYVCVHDSDGHMTKASANSQYSLALCMQFHYCRKAVYQIENRKGTALVLAMLMVNILLHITIYSLTLQLG